MKNILLSISFATFATYAYGADMNITLHPHNGAPINMGTLTLTAKDQGYHYQLSLQDALFSDHFLSMRPFRCMQGPEYMLCYLPYPYPKTQRINRDDLTDLEYDLLFIRKYPSEFGIDAWNGVYYRLKWVQAHIHGELQEVDLNILAVPPEDGVTRPITLDDLTPGDPDSHWLPTLRIESQKP